MVWPEWPDALLAVFLKSLSDLKPLTDTEDVSVVLNALGPSLIGSIRVRPHPRQVRARTTL